MIEADKTKDILNYWYNLEFFSPFWPLKTQETLQINKPSKKLPWIIKDDPRYIYDIYLGKIKSQDLIDDMLDSIGEKDDSIEKDSSLSCICAFKLASDGTYIENSFSVTPFVWAVAKIIAEKNLRTNLSIFEIDQLNNEMNEVLISVEKKLEFKDLKDIYTKIMKKILLNLPTSVFCAIINKKFTKKNDEENDNETNISILSSFYVSDIDMIRHKVQKEDKIANYIESLNNPKMSRLEIDVDASQMKKWVLPEKFPLGKWPSIYSPCLMQQIAINIGISDEEQLENIFSVNGPPGTGKTTLLKEIIASYVVDRAILLSNYQKPDEAFKKCWFASNENEYLKYYYKLTSELNKYGIIVASNNNAAVENISRELPLAEDVKESNSGLFDINENKDIYFSDIAKTLMNNGQECWGLISARLGKKSNIKELTQALWFNKENVNLQQLYKKELPNWKEAKRVFKNKYKEVLSYRKEIENTIEKTNKHKQIVQEYDNVKDVMSKAKDRITALEDLINQKIKEQESVKYQFETLMENKKLLKSKLSFFKRMFSFFFRKDNIISQLKQTKEELDALKIKLTDISLELSRLKVQLDKTIADYSAAQRHFKEKEKAYINSCELMKKYKEQFGNNFADEKFWENIPNNESSQMACPWTDKNYDTLREELFYYALMLQKAFILNSKAVKQNISCLINMWNGSFSEKDKVSSYAHLLNTLFLVIPVLSTTFASVETFLKYIDKSELGTLIIDEAGQVTPHSALGALWRTRKAIIVGDPLQVEPVVTVPPELSKKFAEEFEIPDQYKVQELSVQILADSINPYGGYREYSREKMWLGCPLVIHRRCIDPMFSISNEIAYNNRMFKQSAVPKPDVLLSIKESVWIDINGKEKGGRDHFVPEQGDKAIEIVLNAFGLNNVFPSLYVISPFKSVIQHMKRLLKESIYTNYQRYYNKSHIDNWIEISCGTVHTFQGKEANEVIFILGCDEKSGSGAAQWAGKKPNILNVAVTRAKYRIAIIGDSNLWRKVPNFDVAYKILSKK